MHLQSWSKIIDFCEKLSIKCLSPWYGTITTNQTSKTWFTPGVKLIFWKYNLLYMSAEYIKNSCWLLAIKWIYRIVKYSLLK